MTAPEHLAEHLAIDDVAGYAESSLEPARLPEIEAHLEHCASCLREVAEVRNLIDLEGGVDVARLTSVPYALGVRSPDHVKPAAASVAPDDGTEGALLDGTYGVQRGAGQPARVAGAGGRRGAWRGWLAGGAIGATLAAAGFAIATFDRGPGRSVPAAAAVALPAEHAVRLCGSDTIGAWLMPDLVEAYLTDLGCTSVARTLRSPEELSRGAEAQLMCRPAGLPALRVTITAKGTEEGLDDLARGGCDVAMASRELREAELTRLAPMWGGDPSGREHAIGLAGIQVIVHEDNPAAALDAAMLADVFSGAVTTWKPITGSDRPIHLYAPDDHSGTFETFRQLVLGGRALGKAQRESSHGKLAELIAGDRDGISFVGTPRPRNVKTLALAEHDGDPLLPTVNAIRTEDYLLTRRLELVGPRASDPIAVGLIAFAASDRGQDLVARAGFIDLRSRSLDKQSCAHCSSQYREVTESGHRVRINLRFKAGSVDLDDLGQRDLAWLVSDGLSHLRDKDVFVLGFTDDTGARDANDKLATLRATMVASRLRQAGIADAHLHTTGIGMAMPVDDNRSERGQRRNRRVEIWVK